MPSTNIHEFEFAYVCVCPEGVARKYDFSIRLSHKKGACSNRVCVPLFHEAASGCSFVLHVIDYMVTLLCFMRRGGPAKKLYKLMTLREYEYLEFIRRKNLVLYGEVLGSMKKERFEEDQRANSYHPMKSTDNSVY